MAVLEVTRLADWNMFVSRRGAAMAKGHKGGNRKEKKLLFSGSHFSD